MMTINEALQVLSATSHRGVHLWTYDPSCGRVMPSGWHALDVDEVPPCFTVWETLVIARGLVGIGAVALDAAQHFEHNLARA